MRNHSLFFKRSLLAAFLCVSGFAAHAQEGLPPSNTSQDPLNMNHSDYPSSNQGNATPSAPDKAEGAPQNIHKIPSDVSPADKNSTDQ